MEYHWEECVSQHPCSARIRTKQGPTRQNIGHSCQTLHRVASKTSMVRRVQTESEVNFRGGVKAYEVSAKIQVDADDNAAP